MNAAVEIIGFSEIDGSTRVRFKTGDGVDSAEVLAGQIRVRYASETPEGKTWAVDVFSKITKEWRATTIDSATMENDAQINAWLSDNNILSNLSGVARFQFKQLFHSKEGTRNLIHIAEHGGIQREHSVVLGLRGGIDCGGSFQGVDKDGSYRLRCSDGEARSFRMNEYGGKQLPNLEDCESPMSIHEARMFFADACGAWRANINHEGGAVGIGWSVAGLFHGDVVANRRSFPHLYWYGATKSGKNEIAQWMADMTGMGHLGGVPASSNWKAIRNMLHECDGFPLWVNEFSNENKNYLDIVNLVRDAFDGAGAAVAGMKGGTRSRPPRRGWMMSGEDLFGGDSQHNRYIGIEMRAKTRNDDGWKNVDAKRRGARRAFAAMIVHREALKAEFFEALAWMEMELGRRGYDSRQVFCWAVALAGLKIATHTGRCADAFDESWWVELEKSRGAFKAARDSQGLLATTWNDVQSAWNAGKYANRIFRVVLVDNKRYLGVYTHSAVDGICRPGDTKQKLHKIRSHMREAKWWKGMTRGHIHLDTKGRKRISARLDLLEIHEKDHPAGYPAWMVDAAYSDADGLSIASRDEEEISLTDVREE